MATAGKVDFPAHMKEFHYDLLSQDGADNISSSMVDVMNTALGANPYTGLVSYAPTTYLANMVTELGIFNALIAALSTQTDWEGFLDAAVAKLDAKVFDDTYILADIEAQADLIDDNLVNTVIPKYQAGMLKAGAVMTSAFKVGEALIWKGRTHELIKYATELRMKLNLQRNEAVIKAADGMVQANLTRLEMEKSVLHYTVEIYRMHIAALKEQLDRQQTLDIAEAKWPLEIFQYGANLLASIGGGSVIPGTTDQAAMSSTQSALSGALAGASAGSAIGGNWQSAAVGGLLGAGLSFL